jgi:acyl-CoA dehydrogenase
MDFELSPEVQMAKDTAEKIHKKLEGKKKEIFEKIKRNEFVQEIWDELSQAGFTGAIVPPEYGGTGLGMLASAVVIETLAKYGIGNALFVLTLCAESCVTRNGNEKIKKKFLPPMAEGKIKCALGVTEPEAGTNTFRIKTLAEKKGDRYIINGEKTYITGADVADYILLVTRTIPYSELSKKGLPKIFGLSLFLVDLKSKGIKLYNSTQEE